MRWKMRDADLCLSPELAIGHPAAGANSPCAGGDRGGGGAESRE